MSNLLDEMINYIKLKLAENKQSYINLAALMVYECANKKERQTVDYSSNKLVTVVNDITIDNVLSSELSDYSKTYIEEFLHHFRTGQKVGRNYESYYFRLIDKLGDLASELKQEASQYVISNHLNLVKREIDIDDLDEQDTVDEVYEWYSLADHDFHTFDIEQIIYSYMNSYTLNELYDTGHKLQ